MTERYEADDDEFEDDEYEDDDEFYDDDEDEEDESESEAEPWDLLSQALGSLDELEAEEEISLDVSEQGGELGQAERFSKVPLEQATNLIAVRGLAQGVKDGSITVEVYRSKLKLMVRSLEEGLKVVKSETVLQHLEELPPEQRVFFERTSKLVEALVLGGHQMLKYPETKALSDVDQGLALIEKAFLDLDELQDKAIDMGREIVLRETASE